MDLVTFLAGLFLGTSLILSLVIHFLFKQIKSANGERMLLLNKAFVRDGQTRLFSDEMIAGVSDVKPLKTEKSAPVVARSPFAAGLIAKRQEVEFSKKVEAGSNVPDEIKNKIVEAAEKVKEQRRAA